MKRGGSEKRAKSAVATSSDDTILSRSKSVKVQSKSSTEPPVSPLPMSTNLFLPPANPEDTNGETEEIENDTEKDPNKPELERFVKLL